MRREDESILGHNHVAGDFMSCLEVFVQQRRRHVQRLARIIETGGVGGVHRELPRRLDVHANQVADRVVVFGVAEPPRQYRSWIAGVLPSLSRTHSAYPPEYSLAVRR